MSYPMPSSLHRYLDPTSTHVDAKPSLDQAAGGPNKPRMAAPGPRSRFDGSPETSEKLVEIIARVAKTPDFLKYPEVLTCTVQKAKIQAHKKMWQETKNLVSNLAFTQTQAEELMEAVAEKNGTETRYGRKTHWKKNGTEKRNGKKRTDKNGTE